MPKIDTLVQDIYDLYRNGVDPKDILHAEHQRMGLRIGVAVAESLTRVKEERVPELYMSSVGKPECQLWFQMHGAPKEEMLPHTLIKFLVGNIMEEVMLFLAAQAGHEVTEQQKRASINGVRGKMDAKIDGVTTEVKTASPYGFQKFEDGDLGDDSFGYERQLDSYLEAEGESEGAFFAFHKVLGKLTLMRQTREPDSKSAAARIEFLKEVVACDTPPDRCYDSVPDGKSGNMKLGVVCSYCDYKETCWPGLRTFLYSNGPRFLTTVALEPNVMEKR
jgi:hypothetical protein